MQDHHCRIFTRPFQKAFCFYMHVGVSIKILDLHRFAGVHLVRVIEWSNVWWLSEMCLLTDGPRLLGRSRGWVLSTSDTNRKGNIQWFPKKLRERQTFNADTEYVYGGFPKQVFWLNTKLPGCGKPRSYECNKFIFKCLFQYHPPHHNQIMMKNTTKQQLTKHDHPEWPRANLSNTQPKSQLSCAVCGLGFWPRRALGRLEAWVEGGERVWVRPEWGGQVRDVRWGNVRSVLRVFFVKSYLVSQDIDMIAPLCLIPLLLQNLAISASMLNFQGLWNAQL